MAQRKQPLWLVVVVLVVAVVVVLMRGIGTPTTLVVPGQPGEYVFCFWNVENLFDDELAKSYHDPDKGYDAWFAGDPAILKEKLSHLSEALVNLNNGKGPDILAMAEVESERAAELLRDALNERLKDKPDLQYKTVVMKEIKVGRHIAPAVITRLPVDADKTQQWDRTHRILETHITVNGHDLVLIPSHWTSRLTDKTGEGRAKYADLIHGRYRAMYKSNPDVDVLVCGDFNDTPEDDSVKENLHGSSDPAAVRKANGELMLDLMMGRDPSQYGTHNYHGKWFLFDHIVVSPGMLDSKGWSCDPDTTATVREGLTDKKGRPFPFGDKGDGGPRGCSDHLPVTVRLRVHEGS